MNATSLALGLPQQEPLFATAAGHLMTVESRPVTYIVETAGLVEHRCRLWFTWSCSCGEQAPPENAWSHPDLAERMAVVHVGRAVAS